MNARALTLSLLLLSISPALKAQEDTFRLRVLAYQWTTTHNTMTFSWPGYANTSCNGNSTINGYTYGNNVSATGTSSASCNTTYTPPTNENIDIQKPVVFILADTETSRLIFTCTRNVRWSQCHALNPGFFMARNDKGHFEIQAVSGKGKEEWIRFDIVQQNAVNRQETEIRTVADNRSANGPATTETAPSAPAAPSIEPPSSAPGENMGFPSRWKSMTSGSVRTLRFEPNYIYGEVVLPDAAVKAGAFTLLELKKDGDKFAGKVNAKFVRQDGGASCPGQGQIELTLVTPQRIEGRVFGPLPNARIDWTKCSFLPGPEWQDFTWIPVK
jgi:hypothetical protein